MALTTYTELKTEIASLLWNRTDLVAAIPTFVRLCEAQMFRRLDSRQMQDVTNITISAETAAVPTGFAGVLSFKVTSQDAQPPLGYKSPEALETLYPNSGTPLYYSIVGDNFVFFPYPADGESYTARLRYRKRPLVLSDSNPSNWILTDHPDAYLYGSALHSAPWLKEDERLGTWADLFKTAITDINDDSMRQEYGATLQLEPSGEVA